MEIDTIGIDLGKTVFHLVGLSAAGEVVVRRKFSRTQLLRFTANLRVRLMGMEACAGSHFLGGRLREQGHEVRLMPARYVKPYVKTNKNDYVDAEAIAEAVGRANMRFVPIKSDEQLDMQSLHRVRDRWVARRSRWSTRCADCCWSAASPSARDAGMPKRACRPSWKTPIIACPGFCACCWRSCRAS